MEIALLACALIGSVMAYKAGRTAGHAAGYAAGHTKGFDEGWVKRHFEQPSYEIHKRDRRGRFAPAKST